MSSVRKFPLITNEVYHIFNKSIAGYKIFNQEKEFIRMQELLGYYQWDKRELRFSVWKTRENEYKKDKKGDNLVDIIAYCIMPTHIHLLLKQLKDKGISIFMSQICNSYSRYFNEKNKRSGPLFEREFKNVLVTSDEQILHLTRYIHLNPTTASLVELPEGWRFSSYREFLGDIAEAERICNFKDIMDINPVSYKKFTEDRISCQRELARIKDLVFE